MSRIIVAILVSTLSFPSLVKGSLNNTPKDQLPRRHSIPFSEFTEDQFDMDSVEEKASKKPLQLKKKKKGSVLTLSPQDGTFIRYTPADLEPTTEDKGKHSDITGNESEIDEALLNFFLYMSKKETLVGRVGRTSSVSEGVTAEEDQDSNSEVCEGEVLYIFDAPEKEDSISESGRPLWQDRKTFEFIMSLAEEKGLPIELITPEGSEDSNSDSFRTRAIKISAKKYKETLHPLVLENHRRAKMESRKEGCGVPAPLLSKSPCLAETNPTGEVVSESPRSSRSLLKRSKGSPRKIIGSPRFQGRNRNVSEEGTSDESPRNGSPRSPNSRSSSFKEFFSGLMGKKMSPRSGDKESPK